MQKQYLKISILIISVKLLFALTSCGKIGIPECHPTFFWDWQEYQDETLTVLSENDTKKSTEEHKTEENEILSDITVENVGCQDDYVERIIRTASCLEDGLAEKM